MHESNSFSEKPTGFDQFTLAAGPDVLIQNRRHKSVLGAYLEKAAEYGCR
jgi:hypothetical protein